MDELRNLVIIVPALGTILISVIWFLSNLYYNKLKDEFNPVIREYSKIESFVRVFLVLFYSVLAIFFILFIIIRPRLDKTEEINNTGNLGFMIAWILFLLMIGFIVIVLTGIFTKHITKVSYSEREKIKNKFMRMLIIAVFLCTFLMIIGLSCVELLFGKNIIIAFNGNTIHTKISMDAFKKGYKNNLGIKVNGEGFKVYDKQDEKGTLNTIKISAVNKELYVNKTFKVTEGDLIEIKEGNRLIVKDRYRGYGYWISISEKIIVIVIPIVGITVMLGMYFTLKKFYSLKKYVIRCSNADYVGQIWFDYDNFYLVRIKEEFKYIAKSQINTLYFVKDINDKDKMQITEAEGLKIGEIYNIKQFKQWKVYINIKITLKKIILQIKRRLKKLLLSAVNTYNKALLIEKIIVIIIVGVGVYMYRHI